MQLKLHSLCHLLGQRVAIQALCSVVGKLGKIVGLKLYAVQLFVAAEALYLLFAFFGRQRIFAVLVGSELIVELFL